MHILQLNKEAQNYQEFITAKIQIKMSKIRVRLVKSQIGRTKKQKLTLEALGLNRIDSVVEHSVTPQISGMIEKVKHLVVTEEI